MTNKGVLIVYRNYAGIVKEYFIIPHEKTMRFGLLSDSCPKAASPDEAETWLIDAEVVRSPDNVTRTFAMSKILEWKKA